MFRQWRTLNFKIVKPVTKEYSAIGGVGFCRFFMAGFLGGVIPENTLSFFFGGGVSRRVSEPCLLVDR